MKKIILFTLTTLMMVGCDDKNQDGSYDTSRSLEYGIIVIDSCEYINGFSRLAHKGNCRFCKERREKELKELDTVLGEKMLIQDY